MSDQAMLDESAAGHTEQFEPLKHRQNRDDLRGASRTGWTHRRGSEDPATGVGLTA